MAKRRFTTSIRLGAVSTLTVRVEGQGSEVIDLSQAGRHQELADLGRGLCEMHGITAAPKKARRPWRGPRGPRHHRQEARA